MKEPKLPIVSKLNRIINRIEFFIKQQELKSQLGSKHTLVSNKEFMRLLEITSQTATNWREKEILPFVMIESKIYYTLSDVRDLIDTHYSGKKKG
jgi:uncharacterized protein YqgV (UPF0045/DUF77 family)